MNNKFNRPVGHTCSFSTGICGNLTAGIGNLSAYGYFEYPCEECCIKMQIAIGDVKQIGKQSARKHKKKGHFVWWSPSLKSYVRSLI